MDPSALCLSSLNSAIIAALPDLTLPKALAQLLVGRDDADLLVRLRRRDPEGAGLLFDRYGKSAYTLAFRILEDAGNAENAVCEAMLRCWSRVAWFRETRGGVFGIWFLKLTYDAAIERLRSQDATSDEEPLQPRFAQEETILHGWSKQFDVAKLQDTFLAFSKLTATERQLLDAAVFENLTPSEMVAKFGRTRLEIDQTIESVLDKVVFHEQE